MGNYSLLSNCKCVREKKYEEKKYRSGEHVSDISVGRKIASVSYPHLCTQQKSEIIIYLHYYT